MKLLFFILPLVLCRLGTAAFICRPAKSTLLAEVLAIASPRDGSAFGIRHRHARQTGTALSAEKKVAALVSGEELEKMLADLDQPLVVDAYATWCGPCLLMSPEFESAATELQGKVRFVKLDTDKDESMAARLQIQGLPTLLFLDKYDGEEDGAKAVLKGRIEGALRKGDIVSLCEHYYFGAPAPELY